jgi:alkylhydroperoxidase family enzyme
MSTDPSPAPAGARIAPAAAPFPPEVQAWLDRTMPPGVPPLALFTTLARDPRLFQRFMAGGLLDRGNLTLRQRELVIDRVTARCGSEYEWGVHVALFGARVGLGAAEQRSLVHGGPADGCWTDAERALLAVCDALHERCTVDDPTWDAVRQHLGEEALVEVLLLAGFYRTVSYLTGALRLPLEPFAPRFPPAPGA